MNLIQILADIICNTLLEDEVIKETCEEISKRYDLYFLEIGTDKDHVHFLIQSVPSYSPTQIVKKKLGMKVSLSLPLHIIE